jgi:alpha-mannosidase
MCAWGHFANGTVHLICSSHNDIAWFDTPSETIAWRDSRSITPALERMTTRPDVTFVMENVLYLLEYLERHPERREEIRQLTLEKRLDWGATYNQPYESILSGEQLVRQVYLGRKLLKKLLPGVDPRVYYSPDVPGRAMQMPQILAKAGIPYMLISRHKPGLYHWYSPDGSRVLMWTMGFYGATLFYKDLEGPLEKVSDTVQSILESWSDDYRQRELPAQFAFLYTMDYVPPKDFDQLLGDWNAARTNGSAGEGQPELCYSTPEAFLDAVAAADAELDSIQGERPNVWLYIHGPGHHHALDAKREAGVLLPAAEMFSAIAMLVTGKRSAYPSRQFDQAWANAIYDDHGWGGYNGHITDEVFLRRLVTARDQGRYLLNRALDTLAEAIRTDSARGVPVVVFNQCSWERTDLVSCSLPSGYEGYRLVDGEGNEIAYQLRPDTNGIGAEAGFVAAKVPPIGYTTYYAIPAGSRNSEHPQNVQFSSTGYENRFYKASLGQGGLESLFDKELSQELLYTGHYLGAEVFMLESVGNGAGEFGSIQQPLPFGDFERVSEHKPTWKITENGPVYVTYSFTQPMRHCTVVQSLIFYHTIKRIDCKISITDFDGTKSREFRMALPLAMFEQEASVAYEVPMGVVEIGKSEIAVVAAPEPVYRGGGPAYTDDCRTIHPREVQNFASASNDVFGVTLSMSVSVFDHVDPRQYRNPATPEQPRIVLQPLLFASRKDCHSRGGWYLQAGDHHFSFSLTSHQPGWADGFRAGVAANAPLRAIVKENLEDGGVLPPTKSFVGVVADNVVVSTLKKCEDDNNLVLRCYEIAGRDTSARIELGFPVISVQQTNIIEEPAGQISNDGPSFTAKIGRQAIETYKLVVSQT